MTRVARFFHIAAAAVVLCFLFSCAGKETGPAPLPELMQNKDEVLRKLSSSMPEACEYLGRTNIQFADKTNKGGAGAILNKECSGDMDIRILGPFGIQLAELLVRGGEYYIFQNGKDVTANPPIRINSADLVLLKNYLTLPPPLPDENYMFMLDISHYIFILGDEYIYVNPYFYVDRVIKGDHKVDYVWEEGVLKYIHFARGGTELAVEFIDPWKVKK